jgi:Protein of unknown function (DUF2934)
MFCARRGSSQCGCLRRVGQVNTPWRTHSRAAYPELMKQNNFSKNQNPAAASPPDAPAFLSQNEINYTPSPDEVARRAYFTYVNQGSPQGHEVQHWLQAEAELIQERKPTRIHRFHDWDMK